MKRRGGRSVLRRVAAIAWCVAVCWSAGFAQAEAPPAAKAQAQVVMREGNALLGQGRATDALMKFTEAYQLFPSPKLHYNLGQAHSLIAGHEAQAYESMSRFLSEASDANPELRAAAETQRQQLRPKVGLVSVAADPADADLLIDDVNVGKVPQDAPQVMGIGTHRLSLKKDAAVSGPETITIAGGETLQVRLTLAPVVAPPSPPPPAPPPAPTLVTNAGVFPRAHLIQVDGPPASSRYWTWQRKLGAGLAGVGVASLALGIVEHVRYFGKKDDFVKANCGTDPMILSGRPDCQALNNQFDSAHTWWVVGYVGAAVLGGTGAYFLWIAPGDAAGARESAVASVSSGATVNFSGRF